MATTKPKETESIADGLANDGLPPFVSSAANTAAKDIPVAAIASTVEKGAEMADPIYQVLKQTLTPANIGKVIDQAVPILNAATGTVVGTIDATGRVVSTLGTVVGKISDNAAKIISQDGVELCKVAKEAVKDISNNFKDVGIALIGAWATTAQTFINAGASVVTVGIKSLKERTIANDRNKMIKWIVGAVVVAIIIIVVIVEASKPKKMTNKMSTPVEFDQNYNPESQPCFTEKEYKYYNELAI
jgi:hypothetical protein